MKDILDKVVVRAILYRIFIPMHSRFQVNIRSSQFLFATLEATAKRILF